ncbi:MAG: 6-phosphofructokinase [bacterium]|nr:6-phosphofructokinase [bacterium]
MSNKLIGNAIIGQSGGPSSVINSSIYGAIKTALEAEEITRVYGAANGIIGVLNDQLYDLNLEDSNELELLKYTPASALGSCRHKLPDFNDDDTEYKRILEVFKKYNIRYFFYNGGNDSMDTCNKISKYCIKSGYECRIIGIPKTIDNDLFGTDHCPGFASAAKYIATSIAEISLDTRVYDYGNISIVEIMGRNAGWLAASAALSNLNGVGVDLIYLPEVPFDLDKFVDDVNDIYEAKGKVVVAVSEGIKDIDGKYISEYASKNKEKDKFGHMQMGGLAQYLANVVKARTGAKIRGIELSLLQRCAAHLASRTDYEEAFIAGKAAVINAIDGKSDVMISFKCARGSKVSDYKCEIELLPLDKVANFEKKVPLDWINNEGNNVTKEFIDYVLPLIQGETELPKVNGLPRFAKLKKYIVR